jgi:hypothetical protein
MLPALVTQASNLESPGSGPGGSANSPSDQWSYYVPHLGIEPSVPEGQGFTGPVAHAERAYGLGRPVGVEPTFPGSHPGPFPRREWSQLLHQDSNLGLPGNSRSLCH